MQTVPLIFLSLRTLSLKAGRAGERDTLTEHEWCFGLAVHAEILATPEDLYGRYLKAHLCQAVAKNRRYLKAHPEIVEDILGRTS